MQAGVMSHTQSIVRICDITQRAEQEKAEHRGCNITTCCTSATSASPPRAHAQWHISLHFNSPRHAITICRETDFEPNLLSHFNIVIWKPVDNLNKSNHGILPLQHPPKSIWVLPPPPPKKRRGQKLILLLETLWGLGFCWLFCAPCSLFDFKSLVFHVCQ